MFRRRHSELVAAIATLDEARVEVLTCYVVALVDHVEALDEQRRPPIARMLDEFRPEGRPQ